ncbi:MAG: DUF6339 family protein [Patescibacteria group bacterium]
MEYQKLFKQSFIHELAEQLKKNQNTEMYLKDNFVFDNNAVLENKEIALEKPVQLIMPEVGNDHDFENSKIIYEAYKHLTPTQATDVRIWTYLAHATFWNYMKLKHPVLEQEKGKIGGYILKHWFLNELDPSQYLTHDIALLWWVAHLTYEETKDDPYELTREMFLTPGYIKILLPGIQSKNSNFIHALLEFIKENPSLFSVNKEKKIEFLVERADYLGGYKVLPALSKDEIKDILEKFRDDLNKM